MAIIELKDISKHFGGLVAVNHVSFSVNKGEIFGIIGPNGAGKSTIINMITGTYKPTSGKVFYKEKDVTGQAAHTIAAHGIGRSFQLPNVFREHTVLDNMRVAFHLPAKVAFWKDPFFRVSSAKKESEIDKKALEILQFVGLDRLKDELSKNLPAGYERLLGLGMTLANDGELIILDEPATGMNPTEINHVMDVIRKIRDSGKTVLTIEHNMRVIMGLCDRLIVLNFGQKIAEGTVDEIQSNKTVEEVYLGGGGA